MVKTTEARAERNTDAHDELTRYAEMEKKLQKRRAKDQEEEKKRPRRLSDAEFAEKYGTDPQRPVGAADDHELLNALLTHWRRYVLSTAISKLAYKEKRGACKHFEADDIAQEAMIVAMRRIRNYSAARGLFRHWLSFVVKDVLNKVFVKEEYRANVSRLGKRVEYTSVNPKGDDLYDGMTDPKATDPADTTEANDFWEALAAKLTSESNPNDTRQSDAALKARILILRFRVGMMPKQCGEELGISMCACGWHCKQLESRIRSNYGEMLLG